VSLPLWFEVSIKSAAAEDYFKQNMKLELGEEVAWTQEMITDASVLKSIWQPASDIVKQMDGVGFWNYNGLESVIKAEESSLPTERRQNVGARLNANNGQTFW
jgi:hypothetical protein